MTGRPLSELNQVDWAVYQDAYGPASHTPTHVRALMSSDAEQREEALAALEAALFHQGIAPCEAFLLALPFLRFVLKHGPLEGWEPLLDFLREVQGRMPDFDFPDGVVPGWWRELDDALKGL